MPTIRLRDDQDLSLADSIKDGSSISVFAPRWVEKALATLAAKMKGASFSVLDHKNKRLVDSFRVDRIISLQQLQMMARNEPTNVTGAIDFALYRPDITDPKVIFAIKDLVKFCTMVGKQRTTHYGGYMGSQLPQSADLYICDLIGLQFQKSYNSGRLVLIGDNVPSGLLDDFIYENSVGQKKPTVKQCAKDTTGRFVLVNDNVYFDTVAYMKIVANDVILVGLALEQMADQDLNLKFLKYGSGFFAGSFKIRQVVNQYIVDGIADGVTELFGRHSPKRIKRLELCHYGDSPIDKLKDVCNKIGIKLKISRDDALKKTSGRLITAVTNCADPHAAFGNEMGFSSVDAMIAENLEGKGHAFNPCLNATMKSAYIDF